MANADRIQTHQKDNRPEGWPSTKLDLIIIIIALQGMLNCSNPSLF